MRWQRLSDAHVLLGIHVVEFPADNHAHQLLLVKLFNGFCVYVFSVPEHRNPVADVEKFFELVGNVDDGRALLRKAADDAVELLDFHIRQGGGRLVHDDDFRIVGNRAQHFDKLHCGNGQAAHARVGVDFHAHFRHHFLRAPQAAAHIQQPMARKALFAANPYVLRHRHIRHQAHFLMNHGYARAQGVRRGLGRIRPALENHRALRGFQRAKEDIHHG